MKELPNMDVVPVDTGLHVRSGTEQYMIKWLAVWDTFLKKMHNTGILWWQLV